MDKTPISFLGNPSSSREQFRNELDAVSPSFCAAKTMFIPPMLK